MSMLRAQISATNICEIEVRMTTPPHGFYFDNNATTPIDASVRDAMLPMMDGVFGNKAKTSSCAPPIKTTHFGQTKPSNGAWPEL